MGEIADGAMCILWHPRGSRPDEELVGTLQRRGFRTILCDNAVEATAWICRTARGRMDAANHASPVVLLMDRPGLLMGADACRDSVELYAPASVCWVHDPTVAPRLRAAAPGRAGQPDAAATRGPAAPGIAAARGASSATRAPFGAQHLRLTGDDRPMSEVKPAGGEPAPLGAKDQEGEDAVRSSGASLRNLLSDEELAMLLHGVDADGSTEQSPDAPNLRDN